MGLIGRLFGSEKATQKIVDSMTKGLDKTFYSKEERDDYKIKLLDWTLKYYDATKGSNIARRVIGVMVVFVWCLMQIVSVAYNLSYDPVIMQREDGSMYYMSDPKGDRLERINSDTVTPFAMLVGGFYFGVAAAGLLIDKSRGKH